MEATTVPPPRTGSPVRQPPPSDALLHAAIAAIVVALLADASIDAVTRVAASVLAPFDVSLPAAREAVGLIHVHAQLPAVPPGDTAQALIVRTGVARQAAFTAAAAMRVQVDLETGGGAPPLLPPAPAAALPSPEPSGEGAASELVRRTRPERVARFGAGVRDRLAAEVLAPQHQFPVDPAVLAKARERERRYLAQHLAAERARREAAARVDATAQALGTRTLGWHAILDKRTTPDCRQLHGSNFGVVSPPMAGYPGTLHGGTCRCRAGAPFLNRNGPPSE